MIGKPKQELCVYPSTATTLECVEWFPDGSTVAVLRLRGEIDLATEDRLLSAVGATVTRHERLVVDIREVTFASVHSLELLASMGVALGLHRSALVGRPETLRLLSVLQIDDAIDCFASLGRACAKLR